MHEIDDSIAASVRQRALRGERISVEEVRSLLAPTALFDLLSLGRDLRQRRHGPRVSVSIADHPAEFCGRCPFCDFGETEPSPSVDPGALCQPVHGRPFHAPLGFDPRQGLAPILELIRDLRQKTGGCELQAITLRGVGVAAAVDRSTLRHAFEALRDAGVERLRGGGPVDPGATNGAEALAWHRQAHDAGIRTEIGICYDAEPSLAFVSLLDAVRREVALRAATFTLVVPIPRDADSTGFTDLRAVAAARVMLDGVVRVGVSFAELTEKLAPLALACGADSLAVAATCSPAPSPTAAPDPTHFGVSIDEIRRLVREANLDLHVQETDALNLVRPTLG